MAKKIAAEKTGRGARFHHTLSVVLSWLLLGRMIGSESRMLTRIQV